MCRRSQGRITALREGRAPQSAGSPPAIDQSVAANVPSRAALRPSNNVGKVWEDLSISLPFREPSLDFFWTPASIHHPVPSQRPRILTVRCESVPRVQTLMAAIISPLNRAVSL